MYFRPTPYWQWQRPEAPPPHKPLTQPKQQDNPVRQVTFRLQCRRTAVNERFTPVQGGTVIQQSLAAVYRLIPQQGRDTEVQEQHLARRGKERMVIAALARVLRRRDMRVPVWDVAPERLPAEHPLVSFFSCRWKRPARRRNRHRAGSLRSKSRPPFPP